MRAIGASNGGRLGWAAVITMVVVAGCNSDGTETARPHDPTVAERTASGASAPHDAFEAVRIRVHPLSRRIDPTGAAPSPAASAAAGTRAELEVRVEVLDRDDIETRSLGQLWLELESNGARWTVGPVNLTNMDVNRATFETITRTYRLSVTLPEAARPEMGSVIAIDAFLRLPSGTLLQDRREIRWR